jgi:Protein of unknown function (DUF1592)/Protein of unknown function (DUF1588)/Protein of unknown function (DUF1595)/Protein of unknown function (DUF1585)/Protein of unknown function (DUF1587)
MSPLRCSAFASVTLVVAATVGAACSTGQPAAPRVAAVPATGTDTAIGPSPLRRMSDSQYLNALSDLFPTLSPALPELPADVPVAGFDNAASGQEPSDVLIARYETIANLYAQAATADTPSVAALTGCSDWSTTDLATSCASQFIAQTGLRIFRRPLTTAESQRFLTRFQGWQAAVDFPGAVDLTVSTMLQSPQFIYWPEPAPNGSFPGQVVPVEAYALATRLAFFLWQSVPDDALLAAAGQGELESDAQVAAQADRMLDDARAKRVVWSFHRQWLALDRITLPEGETRTAAVDPDWTTNTQSSALTESELFVENTITQGGTFDELLTSPRAWVNGEMARVYGLPAPADPTSWNEVRLPASERAGLFTRVAFLAGYSHAGATSPPVRGNGIMLRLLCGAPLSPPPGVDLSQPMVPPDAGPETNRELFEQRTAPAQCQTCHAALNGFGFGLEGYNAAGHTQTTDDGLPVDATGTISGTDVDGPFDGGIQLSDVLATSVDVHACATQSWMRFALGRAPTDGEQPTLTSLNTAFVKSSGDVRALLLGVVTSPSFRTMLVGGN